MCTHMSHTVFNGNCLCGTIRDGVYCAARGRARRGGAGPPIFKVEGRPDIMSNEDCCREPENCKVKD